MIEWQAKLIFASYARMIAALYAIGCSHYDVDVVSEEISVKEYPQLGLRTTLYILNVEGVGEASFNLVAKYAREKK